MCLESKWRFPKRAKQDIVCYKVLVNVLDGFYETPYQHKGLVLNSLVKAKGSSLCFSSLCYRKTAGYIHAYLEYISYDDQHDFIVVKAIIPKGTKFHISRSNNEICAKKMFITDQIIKLNELHNLC